MFLQNRKSGLKRWSAVNRNENKNEQRRMFDQALTYPAYTTFSEYRNIIWLHPVYRQIFTCSKSTIETLEKGVKYVQS